MAAWLAAWLPTSRRGSAIEVGAGPGLFTRHLADWSGNLVVTDLSPVMCAAGKRSLPALDWRPMGAEELEGGPWDWIFSSSMLQWTHSPETLFHAWRERLSPSGRILGGLFVEGSLSEWQQVGEDLTPLEWRSATQWVAALRGSGLKVVRGETEVRTFWHRSSRDFLRSVHGVGAAPKRVVGPSILRRMLQDYERRFAGTQGVPATWVFFRFEAAV